MSRCKGVCPKYKKINPGTAQRYANGQKRCQICEIFIEWEGLWCPCCGYRLRANPRSKKFKDRLRESRSEKKEGEND